jgi:4-amino-4-deoxy-L-arabinose transferase-like glycosyltransferase
VRAVAGGVCLAAFASVLFFADLNRYALWDPDEARHAEVAREMVTGEGARRFFLPTLELDPYREKPAPFYWLVGLAYQVGGVGAGSARAVSACAGLFALLVVYLYALRRHGVAGALGAGLVLATSAGWFGLARFVNLDMTLTACIATGVLAGLAWLERPRPRRPPLAPYVAAALGTLVKGPLAAVLVAGPLVLAAAVQRPRPRLAELGLVRGLLVLGGLVAAFWTVVALLDPSYAERFLTTNLRRFGDDSPHAAPVYYYLLWLPALFLPWTLLGFGPLVRAARDPHRRAMLLWVAFVPALLTLARGKLATYALSALVPLALLVGPELARTVRDGPPPEDVRVLRVAGWLAVVLLIAGAIAVPLIGSRYPLGALGRALLVVAALGWAAGFAALLMRDRLALAPLAVVGTMLTVYPLVVRVVAPAVSVLHSDREAARLIEHAGPAPVIAFAARAPSLVFYLGTPVICTEDPTLVHDLFTAEAPVFLVTGHRHFDAIEQLLGARAHRWYGTPRRRLYGNRPPPPAVAERNGSE